MSGPPVMQSEGRRGSRIPPLLAFLISFFGPGIGHMFAGAIARGLLLFVTFATILGLWIWRINVTARREILFLDRTLKSIRLEPLLGGIAILTLLLWLWIAIDAYRVAKLGTRGSTLLLVLVLLLFFGLGWQIGEIDLVRLATEVNEAGPRLVEIMWPWERAISREQQLIVGSAPIQVPCTDTPPEPPEESDGQPHLVADPTCGLLSEQDGTPGTNLLLTGKNYLPNTPTEIWWEDPLNNEFRQRQAGEYLVLDTDSNGEFQVEVVMPYRLVPASAQGPQIWEVQGRQVDETGEISTSTELRLAVTKMIETIFLGMMATFFGIIFALPVSFLAAKKPDVGEQINSRHLLRCPDSIEHRPLDRAPDLGCDCSYCRGSRTICGYRRSDPAHSGSVGEAVFRGD